MKKYLLLVAGGTGKRMGTEIPKQFLVAGKLPVMMHSINRFLQYDPRIETIIVMASSWIDYWKNLAEEYGFSGFNHLVEGGKERFHSVKNGLSLVSPGSLVAIHDAVRPLVNIETINRCFETAASNGNAIPFVAPQESVRMEKDDNTIAVDRRILKIIQTPQVFRSDLIIEAYAKDYSPAFTDDATLLESTGVTINLVEGNRENIKITTSEDLLYAGQLLGNITS